MVPDKRKVLKRKLVKIILCRLFFVFIQLHRGNSTSQGHSRRDIFGLMQKQTNQPDTQVLHMVFSTFVALLIEGSNLTKYVSAYLLSNFIYFDKPKNITYILSANLSKIRAQFFSCCLKCKPHGLHLPIPHTDVQTMS